MIIRDAIEQDIDQCVELAKKFYQHTEFYGRIPFDESSVYTHMLMCLDAKIFAVADYSKIVGFACGVKSPSLMNRDYSIGAELAWWVEPEYRGTSSGIKLLKHVENQAKEAGCFAWSMMCMESLNPDEVESLYIRLGYSPSERTFVRFL